MITSMASSIEVSVPTQAVFTVAGFPVTNAILTGLFGLALMFGVFGYVIYMVNHGKYNRFVGLVQWCFEGMANQVREVIPDKKNARLVMPVALSIFFVMLASYWMSVLPGLDSVKSGEAPIIRSLAADLNFVVVVALIVFVMVQYLTIKAMGPVGNLKRYFKNPLKDPIASFAGILEIVGEVSRYSALAVRMFGNCFAGELLLVILSLLLGYVAALVLPFFLLFELFIGFIQSYVFFILAIIFTSLALEEAEHMDHSAVSTKHSVQRE